MKKTLSLFVMLCFALGVKAQIISDFESWHNFVVGATTLTIPNGWNSTDSTICYYGALTNPGGTFVGQVSKEMPGNGGGTAIKAETKTQSAITGYIGAGPMPCLASNSVISVDANLGFTFVGGTPFTYNPYSASMWVKNNPVGGDTTEITILAIDDSDGGDSLALVADTLLSSPINNYTQITIPFVMQNATFSTTKIRVIISSSANFGIDTVFTNLHAGTSIVVDDIMISAPNGVSQYILSEKIAAVYPTPASDVLHINLQASDKHRYQMNINDMQGRCVKSCTLTETLNNLDITSLPVGQFAYTITLGQQIVQNGKFAIVR